MKIIENVLYNGWIVLHSHKGIVGLSSGYHIKYIGNDLYKLTWDDGVRTGSYDYPKETVHELIQEGIWTRIG